MPRISSNKYHLHDVSVTRTVQGGFHHSKANVFTSYPHPASVIDRLDALGMEYFEDSMVDLYNEDFLWGMSIQTAHLQGDRRILYPKRDRVLDRLITMGMADVPEKFVEGELSMGRDVPTSLEMHHASSIKVDGFQHLLGEVVLIPSIGSG